MGIMTRIQQAQAQNERAANDRDMCEFQARYERQIAAGNGDYGTLKQALREMRDNPQISLEMMCRVYGC